MHNFLRRLARKLAVVLLEWAELPEIKRCEFTFRSRAMLDNKWRVIEAHFVADIMGEWFVEKTDFYTGKDKDTQVFSGYIKGVEVEKDGKVIGRIKYD